MRIARYQLLPADRLRLFSERLDRLMLLMLTDRCDADALTNEAQPRLRPECGAGQGHGQGRGPWLLLLGPLLRRDRFLDELARPGHLAPLAWRLVVRMRYERRRDPMMAALREGKTTRVKLADARGQLLTRRRALHKHQLLRQQQLLTVRLPAFERAACEADRPLTPGPCC
ncbi:hypothetical protein [Mumia zhuanghuii]|uniref:Uncharacterized protein n=1 Tax=Mumia zhuanghuii TaxID=2585211 RepID=A0A5C4LS32_9ACTN|nr:hypothetical protein [Mumia zhuanghuii]TNC21761.1 hypothetical protein FHE65_36260 [Mumia zhuanghuii]